MKKMAVYICLFPLLLFSTCRFGYIDYPVSARVDTIDNYFGIKVHDPYRWLEDGNSIETGKWIAEQNALTYSYLSEIPFRDEIRHRITQLYDHERMGTPFKAGGNYFFTKNKGLQNQPVYYIMEDPEKPPRVILDPNEFSEDGTVSLSEFSVSGDGKYVAYTLSTGGSDWQEIFVRDIQSGELLEDHVRWVKFSRISWYGDGFYYSRFDEPDAATIYTNQNSYHSVYYHKLGTLQSEDKLIYRNPSAPDRMYNAVVTDDEGFLVLYEREWSRQGNEVFVARLGEARTDLVRITNNAGALTFVIGNVGNTLYMRTNDNAPNYRLISIDFNKLPEASERLIVPEKNMVLQNAHLAGGKIVTHYKEDVQSILEVYDISGNYQNKVDLPGTGTISDFKGDFGSNTAFYSFVSYTQPATVYQYDVKSNNSLLYFAGNIDFDPGNYVTTRVFYKSKDGSEVPMFISHHKDIKPDGNNPALLFGYGGFNVILPPRFEVSHAFLMENGFVFANANIRGGGEYGKDWHEGGIIFNKQNVFDDFIAAAEYLIDNKYTSPDKLVVQGRSNGGLLVGAVINQRPDLFKVALPAVGVMDMLRFHKFTIGGAWVRDYGSSDDSLQFLNLYKYSPIHNITANQPYPAVFVTTAEHDDRVVPAHSFKYIATLQEKHRGKNPALIRIQTQAGHGAGKPTSMAIDELADILSFTLYNLGLTPIIK